jgi:hypothetical protein
VALFGPRDQILAQLRPQQPGADVAAKPPPESPVVRLKRAGAPAVETMP